jgi:hypothetical protein
MYQYQPILQSTVWKEYFIQDVVVRTYRLLGPLGGVIVSLVTLSAVDRGLNLWLDQR